MSRVETLQLRSGGSGSEIDSEEVQIQETISNKKSVHSWVHYNDIA
jgi:hypothetical protein